jgi:hypothetical protein
MAGNAQGPWQNPLPGEEDESYPNAFWGIINVTLTKGANPNDGHAIYHIWKDQAAKQAGRKPRWAGSVSFNYVPANGNVYNQALQALISTTTGLIEV